MSQPKDKKRIPVIFYFLLTIVILFIQPLLVHLFLKIPAPCNFFVRNWNAGDLITYIAGFEAFIGTTILGLITLRINNKAIALNEKLIKLESKRDENERQPFLALDRWRIEPVFKGYNQTGSVPQFEPTTTDLEFDDIEDNVYGVFLYLKNVSNVYSAVDMIKFHSYSLEKPSIQSDFSRKNISPVQTFFHVIPGNEIQLGFLFKKETLFNYNYHMCSLHLDLFNTIAEKYTEVISFHITSNPVWLEIGQYTIKKDDIQDPD
ncbi:MAG: hypothetical protein VB061_10930 [Christensenella sp.]|nr:hypothetical protein [Christensenella sp.]